MKNLFVYYRAENNGGQQIENNFIFQDVPLMHGLPDIVTLQQQIALQGNYKNVRIMCWQRMEISAPKASKPKEKAKK